jgi:hypothetical protein
MQKWIVDKCKLEHNTPPTLQQGYHHPSGVKAGEVEALFTLAIRHLKGFQDTGGMGAGAGPSWDISNPTETFGHGTAREPNEDRSGQGLSVRGGLSVPIETSPAVNGQLDRRNERQLRYVGDPATSNKAKSLLKNALLGRATVRVEQALLPQSVADVNEAILLC